MAMPAGWFTDPEDPMQQRYWDGQHWTEHRVPADLPTPVAGGSTPASFSGALSPSTGEKPVPISISRQTSSNFVILVIILVVIAGGISVVVQMNNNRQEFQDEVDDADRMIERNNDFFSCMAEQPSQSDTSNCDYLLDP